VAKSSRPKQQGLSLNNALTTIVTSADAMKKKVEKWVD
jgi:hypothetical protein